MFAVKSVLTVVGFVLMFGSVSLPKKSLAGSELPQDRSYESYVNFIETRVNFYEFSDGFNPGSYGEVNGTLSASEACNVGGKLVHEVPGFAEWSLQLYKEGELTPLGFSILVGGAMVPYFDYRETQRETVQNQSEIDISDMAVTMSLTNIDRLLGNY